MGTKKLKLTEFTKNNFSKKNMRVLKGGNWCSEKCDIKDAPYDVFAMSWYSYFYTD